MQENIQDILKEYLDYSEKSGNTVIPSQFYNAVVLLVLNDPSTTLYSLTMFMLPFYTKQQLKERLVNSCVSKFNRSFPDLEANFEIVLECMMDTNCAVDNKQLAEFVKGYLFHKDISFDRICQFIYRKASQCSWDLNKGTRCKRSKATGPETATETTLPDTAGEASVADAVDATETTLSDTSSKIPPSTSTVSRKPRFNNFRRIVSELKIFSLATEIHLKDFLMVDTLFKNHPEVKEEILQLLKNTFSKNDTRFPVQELIDEIENMKTTRNFHSLRHAFFQMCNFDSKSARNLVIKTVLPLLEGDFEMEMHLLPEMFKYEIISYKELEVTSNVLTLKDAASICSESKRMLLQITLLQSIVFYLTKEMVMLQYSSDTGAMNSSNTANGNATNSNDAANGSATNSNNAGTGILRAGSGAESTKYKQHLKYLKIVLDKLKEIMSHSLELFKCKSDDILVLEGCIHYLNFIAPKFISDSGVMMVIPTVQDDNRVKSIVRTLCFYRQTTNSSKLHDELDRIIPVIISMLEDQSPLGIYNMLIGDDPNYGSEYILLDAEYTLLNDNDMEVAGEIEIDGEFEIDDEQLIINEQAINDEQLIINEQAINDEQAIDVVESHKLNPVESKEIVIKACLENYIIFQRKKFIRHLGECDTRNLLLLMGTDITDSNANMVSFMDFTIDCYPLISQGARCPSLEDLKLKFRGIIDTLFNLNYEIHKSPLLFRTKLYPFIRNTMMQEIIRFHGHSFEGEIAGYYGDRKEDAREIAVLGYLLSN